ncbi:MAG: polyribonucleotide nucleotidyltransferase, partial [Phycisphaerales bacterium]|nr:polyribonucleotide nucleotidyltransferase [Phycisphaerales bacterium]
EAFRDEVLIQVLVLSADLENDPDQVGFIAAAAALAVSQIPFNGPAASVRVGRVDGQFVVNPTRTQLEYSDMDVVVAGPMTAVNMIEVGARELPEDAVADAIRYAHDHGVQPICEMLAELKRHAGQPCAWQKPELDEKFAAKVRDLVAAPLREAKRITGKQARKTASEAVYQKAIAQFCPEGVESPEHTADEVNSIIAMLEEKTVREMILNEKIRPDGRKLDEVRPLTAEVGWLPRVHGSSLFRRGETQSLVTVTLGTSRDEQLIDEMMEEYSKKFMLHYNFPPFSVGEVRRVGAPGRREIGHGMLAERSLEAVLPSPEQFPYTIRLVSDILESNGSSSMASVCGGSLALMDAGVPIKSAVAGVSIGLVEENGKWVLLADIQGEEDHYGDMDFKVAGTRDGVTGVQLDIKAHGITHDIIRDAFKLAKQCRMKILDVMEEAIGAPRAEISQFAPRLITVKINPEKIGKLIGPGGKGIKGIEAATGATIDIEPDGTVFISCLDAEGAKKAETMVQRITEDVQIGALYEGKVISIKDFGAFIEIFDGQDGLCHISELSDGYVKSVTDVVKMGDSVHVKVIAVDDQGRVKLSRKQAMRELESAGKN